MWWNRGLTCTVGYGMDCLSYDAEERSGSGGIMNLLPTTTSRVGTVVLRQGVMEVGMIRI